MYGVNNTHILLHQIIAPVDLQDHLEQILQDISLLFKINMALDI